MSLTEDYLLKQDGGVTRRRHRAFWRQAQPDSPLLHIKARKPDLSEKLPVGAGKSRKAQELDPAWHQHYCRSQIDYDFLFDSMPLAVVMFGRDVTNMGVLAGGDFEIHPASEFIAFHRDPDFLFKPTPAFSPDMPFVRQVKAIYEGLHRDIGRDACLNPPTTADALTTMAMIMGMENFLQSLVHNPEAVRRKAFELNRLFYGFYDHIYTRLLDMGYGESGSWFPVFAEGRFDSVRSDVSVMLSENMFYDFSLPVLSDACARLDYAMFNLDSVKLIRFLPALAKIQGLNGIYWNIEPWLYDLNRDLPVLRQIRESGLLLALPCRSAADAKMAINALGKSGLLLEFPVFSDREDALSAGLEIKNMR